MWHVLSVLKSIINLACEHTCQLSRFGRETPDFEDFSRSPDLNQNSPDLAQDFLNLKINQFF